MMEPVEVFVGNAVLVLNVFLVVAALAIGSIVFLGNYRSHDPVAQAVVTARGYALRRYWFWLTLIVAVAAFAVSIPSFPYARAHADPNAPHFSVIAQQYGFTMPAVVPRNRTVVFDVTSKDVNHGFGIYAPDGRVVGQVQAMPGYVNHLAMQFTIAGHYVVRCLEYCGIAHSAMQGGFEVK